MSKMFQSRLASHYASLSGRLRQAADFVAQNNVAVATRSLRSVALQSDLPPATFTRLSQALGYANFEDLREEMRENVASKVGTFSEKAEKLQSRHANATSEFVHLQKVACVANVEKMAASVDMAALEEVAKRLLKAREVYLVGALGSTGIVEYMSYQLNFLAPNFNLVGRMGASIGSDLADLGPQDAMIVLTKPPFAQRALKAAKAAVNQDAYLVVMTDTLECPVLQQASAHFIVPTESPNFFSSYTATLFLLETLIGLMVAKAGSKAKQRIATVEEKNHTLEEVWDN